MNEIIRFPAGSAPGHPLEPGHGVTQAAEGQPRLAWTLAEFDRMSELGFFRLEPRERIELIDGELVPMPSKGARHEWVRQDLAHLLQGRLPATVRVYGELGWRPGGERYIEPDLMIFETRSEPAFVAPAEVLLIVEVADTSLSYDRTTKMKLYAAMGVREYWSVCAKSLETFVYRSPSASGYAEPVRVPPAEMLSPVGNVGAAFMIRLADLGIPSL